MLREMKTTQRLCRVIGISIDGSAVAGGTLTTTGILEGGQHCKVTENSAGNYTITFNTPFARLPIVAAATFSDVSTLRIVAKTAATVQIEQVGADQTTPLGDADFDLIVMGFDSADQT